MKLEYVEFYAGDVRRNSPKAPESFKTNISITEAQAKGDTLNLTFDYTVGYAPGNSGLHLTGKAAFIGKDAENARKEWVKSKTITGASGEYIVNTIYYHSSLQAIQIARLFGLTAPVVFPQMKFAGKKKK